MTIFHCFLGRSRKTGLTVFVDKECNNVDKECNNVDKEYNNVDKECNK